MVDDANRARFDEAHAEARLMVARLHDVGGHVNGYPVSPAELAAFIVARAVSRRRGAVPAGVSRMREAARTIIHEVRDLVDDPQPMGSATGRAGLAWTLSGGFLHMGGDTYHLSRAVPGIHAALPPTMPDDARLLGMYRHQLLRMGVRQELAAGATATTRGAWTRFETPMPDARLTHGGEIMNAAHLADVKIDDSLASYAKEAVHIQDNAASLGRMADRVARDAETKTAGVEGIEIGTARLHSIGHHSTATLRQRVTMQVPVTTLTPGLMPSRENATYTSELGLDVFTHSGIDLVVDTHRRRMAQAARHGGARIEMTGMAVLASLGHDVEAMITRTRAAAVHPARTAGTDHLSVKDGRIRATAALSGRVRWCKDHIEVADMLPETIMQAIAGRPARTVLDHPAFEGAVVASARRSGRKTLIQLEPRWEIRP